MLTGDCFGLRHFAYDRVDKLQSNANIKILTKILTFIDYCNEKKLIAITVYQQHKIHKSSFIIMNATNY